MRTAQTINILGVGQMHIIIRKRCLLTFSLNNENVTDPLTEYCQSVISPA